MSSTKKNFLLLVDRPGWVFDMVARALIKNLSGYYNFKIAYVAQKPDLGRVNFDYIYVFFWGETYHLKFVKDPGRIIKEVSSHRWENEKQYGYLSPKEMAHRYLRDAGSVTTTSRRLYEKLSPFRHVTYLPNGFDETLFKNKRKRKGKMVVGWAGNIDDPCKGFKDILVPACFDRLELQVAAGDLEFKKMADFYNSVDLITIASTAEGQPLTLIEGMACGCFPVCTDVGIVPELIINGRNGLIVKRSIRDFREAFIWCENNLEFIREAGNKNAGEVLKTRTWSKVTPYFKNFFDSLP